MSHSFPHTSRVTDTFFRIRSSGSLVRRSVISGPVLPRSESNGEVASGHTLGEGRRGRTSSPLKNKVTASGFIPFRYTNEIIFPPLSKKEKRSKSANARTSKRMTKRKTSEGGKVSADETARHGPPSEPALSSPRRECHRLAPRLTAAAV